MSCLILVTKYHLVIFYQCKINNFKESNSNNESSVDKIRNHLIQAIAFSTKILTLATLLVGDTSEVII